jgi:hypothetical protein
MQAVEPVANRPDVCPGAASVHSLTQCVAVVGAICQQDLTGLHPVQHIGGARCL